MVAHQQLAHLLFALQLFGQVALHAQHRLDTAVLVALHDGKRHFVDVLFALLGRIALKGQPPSTLLTFISSLLTNLEDVATQRLEVVAIEELRKVNRVVFVRRVAIL